VQFSLIDLTIGISPPNLPHFCASWKRNPNINSGIPIYARLDNPVESVRIGQSYVNKSKEDLLKGSGTRSAMDEERKKIQENEETCAAGAVR
jgi:hypothetical protein